MKKVTLNYIIIMSVLVVLLILCVYIYAQKSKLDKGIYAIQDSVEAVNDDGEVDDVEGHGAIALTLVGMFGILGSVALGALIIIILIYTFLVFLLATIAKLAFKPYGDGLMAYRIVMSVVYLLFGIPIFFLFESFSIAISITNILGLVGLVAVVIFTGINTYTNRIIS